jgi:DNA-binding GntR family transcriptional regulator
MTKAQLFEQIHELDDEFSPLMARAFTVQELQEILRTLQEDRRNPAYNMPVNEK